MMIDFKDYGLRAIKFTAIQIFSYIKYTQQVAAIIFWAASLIILVVFAIIQGKGYLNFLSVIPEFLIGKSWNEERILGYYAIISLIFYAIMSLAHAFYPPKKYLSFWTKIRRAAAWCGSVYFAIAIFIPFLKMAPGQSRFDALEVIALFGILTFLTTIYAVCVTHIMNMLIDAIEKNKLVRT